MANLIAYELLPRIFNMSVTAGIVILFVLLARLLLRRAPKVFSYALWSVVLFRLLCPVSLSAGFSLLGLVFKSVLVDSAIESFNRRKAFFIITSDPEHVCAYVTHTLGRGATLWKAEGAYTHEVHHVVLTVRSRTQAVALRQHLKQTDPHAFMIVANSSEIFGKGFLRA